MIVYEKNNKLNINFENKLDNPDIEIGKGEINVDGNNIVSGGGSSPLVVTFSGTTENDNVTCDKSINEIDDAIANGKQVIFRYGWYGQYTNNTAGEAFATYQTDGYRYWRYASTIVSSYTDEKQLLSPRFIYIQWERNNSVPYIYVRDY